MFRRAKFSLGSLVVSGLVSLTIAVGLWVFLSSFSPIVEITPTLASDSVFLATQIPPGTEISPTDTPTVGPTLPPTSTPEGWQEPLPTSTGTVGPTLPPTPTPPPVTVSPPYP